MNTHLPWIGGLLRRLALCLALAALAPGARGDEPGAETVDRPTAPVVGWPPSRHQPELEGNWPVPPPDTGWIWRYLLSLLVVGGLMAGAFLMLRRMRGTLGSRTCGHELRILARLALDKHNGLCLLRTAEEVLTIASGPQGVQVLARRPLAPEEAAPAPDLAPARPSFRELLRGGRRGEGTE